MEQFKEEYKEEKGFECWTEGSNYGSYTDDYVNWLEQKLAINYTPCCKSDSEQLKAEQEAYNTGYNEGANEAATEILSR